MQAEQEAQFQEFVMLVSCNSDRFRKRRVAEALTASPPERAGCDDAVRRADERSALLGALGGLPPRQRAVVVMRYWEDLSEAEVAEVLGCSPGTVKSQAAKGLEKLRRYPGLTRAMDGSLRSRTPSGQGGTR
ncbi:sigma-70 family RNA polymerase sigma factor [Streptomyces sp. NPDC086077]|uniref:sigma-70 family RNA polymerase sigma factor n=1 Tax=Streptomyces sp. NPDC086077 TaxID=3154862 RepID=UPI0034132526